MLGGASKLAQRHAVNARTLDALLYFLQGETFAVHASGEQRENRLFQPASGVFSPLPGSLAGRQRHGSGGFVDHRQLEDVRPVAVEVRTGERLVWVIGKSLPRGNVPLLVIGQDVREIGIAAKLVNLAEVPIPATVSDLAPVASG